MIVRKIALNGWRNYEFAAAEFSPGTNVITGENAQGKTNLLEAVYLLTGGKSFRTRFDKELIGFGYTSAEVLADVFAFGREQTVRIVLRQGQRKQIWQNGVKKTAAELAGTFAAVLFCPDDLNIIRDGPAARRRMMDMAISQLRPKYGALLAEYSRLYDQKSAILRDWHEKPSLLDTLDDFSDQMCRVSAKLIRYRAAYASRLNIAAAPIPLAERLERIRRFVPRIENWSVCDSFCASLKEAAVFPAEYWAFLQEFFASRKEFALRFALVMATDHFVTPAYLDRVLERIDGFSHPGYYARMAAAWALSVCFVKFPEEVFPRLPTSRLDDFTYNKALQKICESRQVTPETRHRIRALRRNVTK